MAMLGFYLLAFVLLGFTLYASLLFLWRTFLSKLAAFLVKMSSESSHDVENRFSILFRSYYRQELEKQQDLLKLLLKNQPVSFKKNVLFFKGYPLKKNKFSSTENHLAL